MPDSLNAFEGKQTVGCAVVIKKAGDGLSDALKVDPVELHVNERVFYVLEGEVDQVAFRRLNPASNEVTRVHGIATIRITQVDGADVKAYLDDAEQHLRRAMAEISDDQQTIDDELARQAEAAKTNGSAPADADKGSVTAAVATIKAARAKKTPAAATPTGDA